MIGIFNDNFPPVLDGVGITAQNYAHWLQEAGHDVSVITPYAPNMQDVMASASYPIHRYISIPIPFRPPYRYGLPDIDISFRRKWSKMRFDIVHAHCPFTTGRLARQVAKRQHIPFVATFHSKYRQDFEHNVRSKLIVDLMVKHVIRFFEQADEVWIPLPAVEETLREYGYKGHVEVVENGNDFYASKTQIANMKQRLSSIVQGYGYKNVKEFLSEYRASKAEYTDYQSAVAKSQQNGSKAEQDSLKARLQKKQQEVKDREKSRQSQQQKKLLAARMK